MIHTNSQRDLKNFHTFASAMALELHVLGLSGSLCTVNVHSQSSLEEVKTAIQKEIGISKWEQHLIVGTSRR